MIVLEVAVVIVVISLAKNAILLLVSLQYNIDVADCVGVSVCWVIGVCGGFGGIGGGGGGICDICFRGVNWCT